MSEAIIIEGGDLYAADDERVVRGRLIPFGAIDTTDVGTLTFLSGRVELPTDPDVINLNDTHKRSKVVGRAISIEEKEDGIHAAFRIARTAAGDAWLAEYRSDSPTARKSLSAEIENITRDANGNVLTGTLFGAAICQRGQLAGAVLYASKDDLTHELSEESSTEPTETVAVSDSPTDKEDTMSVLPESNGAVENTAPVLSAETVALAYQTGDTRLAKSLVDDNPRTLFAALDEIPDSAHGSKVAPTQWVGQLWAEKTYTPKFLPLLASGTLTGRTVTGWRFVEGFEPMGDYAGNLTEIPSDAPVTEPYQVAAARMAGGWKIDRSFSDFGDTEFINAIFQAATNDLAKKLDAKALAGIVSLASEFEASAAPSGVNPVANKIVRGAIELLDQDATPTFALVSPDLYADFLLSRQADTLEFIQSSLGLTGGSTAGFTVRPAKGLAAGSVIVGDGSAVSFYTLPGSPIRVEALDVSHGGFDQALFSYHAIVRNSPTNVGLVRVTDEV